MTFLLLSLLACEEDDVCALAAEVDPTLAFGEGESSFSPVSEGHAYEPESGSQGGQHVWVALEASGIDPGTYSLLGDDTPGPQTVVTLTSVASGASRGSGQQVDLPWAGDHEHAETSGIKTFLEGAGAGELLLQAEITDSCGTTLAEEIVVRLQ